MLCYLAQYSTTLEGCVQYVIYITYGKEVDCENIDARALYQPRREAPQLIYSPRVNIFAINLLTIRYTLHRVAILQLREWVKAPFASQGQ